MHTQFKSRRQIATSVEKKYNRNAERISHLTKLLDAAGAKPASILDVGCGNAEITDEIAKILNIRRVYGVDVYPESEFVRTGNVAYSQVCDEKIRVANNVVELVCCFMSIHHFDHFDKMMNEILRVMCSGGYLFIREHDVPPKNMTLKNMLDEKHKQYPDHPGGIINYWGRAELQAELESRGLQYMGSSDYQTYNPQAIYYSLYKKR